MDCPPTKDPKLKKLYQQTLRNPFEGKPHGHVQWKGTNVCLDVHCECGELGHIDADFAYMIRCSKCGRVYATNGHIELVPVSPDGIPDDWHEPITTS